MGITSLSARGSVFAIVLVATIGCSTSEPWRSPGPKDVFETFLIHWFKGEAKAAFEYVLPEDRDRLAKNLAQLDGVPEDVRPEVHEMLVVADIVNVYDIQRMETKQSMETEPAAGSRVDLILHRQDGSQVGATMVWSGERWFVDLPLSGETQGAE